MKAVTRYTMRAYAMGGLAPHVQALPRPDGQWVRFEDYDDVAEALAAERRGNHYIRRALGIRRDESLLAGVDRIAAERKVRA